MSFDEKDANQPVKTEQKEQEKQVVVAEVIEDDDNYNQRAESTISFGVHGRGWRQQNVFVQNSKPFSSLPALITLILTVSMGLQAGFLASIGFLFFYVIGTVLALIFSVRRTLQGRVVYPWVHRILVWTAAYAITVGLTQ